MYDTSFCNTSVGRQLRRQTWKDFDEAFATTGAKSKQAAPILEIGCGTGDDAFLGVGPYLDKLSGDD